MKEKISRRLLATIFGFAFALSFVEIVFRLVGSFHFSEARISERTDGEFRIVALGNSHTYGFGVPRGKAYPDVLDQFLRSERPGFPVRVTNHGIGSANTYLVQKHFEAVLPVERPNLVLMLVGEPNFWNKEGYGTFLNETQGYDRDATGPFIQYLSHSRLFRWLIMLWYMKTPVEVTPEYALEKEAYEILGKHFFIIGAHRIQVEEGMKIRDILNRYLEKTKSDPPLAVREFRVLLARLEWVHYMNYQKAVEHLEESFRIHPIRQNPLAALVTLHFYQKAKVPGARKAIQALRDRVLKEFSAKDRKEYFSLFALNNATKKLERESISFLEETRKLIPAATNLHTNLVHHYRENGDIKKAIEIASELLRTNPLQRQSAKIYSNFSSESIVTYPDDVRKIALDAREQFIRRFPTEAYLLEDYDEEKVEKWIQWDLGKIAAMVKRGNAEVVVQNYHWLRDLYPQDRVLSAVEKGARDHGLRYLEQAKIFRQELGTDEESYYIKALGPVARDNHPSEKGHRLIARIIYDYLNSNKLLPVELQNLDSKKLYQYHHER